MSVAQFFADQPPIVIVVFCLCLVSLVINIRLTGFFLLNALKLRSERQAVQHINPTLPVTVEYKASKAGGLDIKITGHNIQEVRALLDELTRQTS